MSPIISCLRYCEFPTAVLCLLLLILVSLPAVADGAANRDLQILGWVEHARLLDPDVHLKAKLDTGAETSSLDVNIIKKFRKGGKRWVRFRLIDRETGEEHVIVRERIRTVSIVMHDAQRQTRPVVLMRFCIAGRILDTEVNLIDRSEFTYPLLLGRKALASFALIDPGSTYLTKPDCKLTPREGSVAS